MKKKNKLSWIISIFFLLSSITFFPSFSSILVLLAGILLLPIDFIQSKVAFYLKKPLKIVVVVVLFLLAAACAPESKEVAVEEKTPAVAEQTEEGDRIAFSEPNLA